MKNASGLLFGYQNSLKEVLHPNLLQIMNVFKSGNTGMKLRTTSHPKVDEMLRKTGFHNVSWKNTEPYHWAFSAQK